MATSHEARNHIAPFPGVTAIDGQLASMLEGRPLSVIRVYAFHDGKFLPIPFQIDERDARNRWVLDHGSQQKPDDSPGIFDANDVLLVMAQDLGQRGSPVHATNAAVIWLEGRVGNNTAPLGFFYIGIFASAPPPLIPHAPQVRYEPESDSIYATRYALAFNAPLPTHLAFVDQFGEFGTNEIAGFRVLAEVRFFAGLFTLQRTDQDIQMRVLGYRQGPIRAIRRARYWVPLPLGFRTTGRVDVAFYRNFVEGSAEIKVKFPPRLLLADGELKTFFRFLDIRNTQLLLEGEQPLPATGSQATARTAQSLSGRPARWAALLLPNGRTLVLLARLEGALQRLEQQVYFQIPAQPNGTIENSFFGFTFSRVQRLHTGTHRMSVFAVMLDSTATDDIARTVQFFLAPPPVHLTVLANDTPQ
ncbi:MAG: hypothetical protein AB7P18_04180 [Candidatus Binatia bacterium]